MLSLRNISVDLGDFKLTDISLDVKRGDYFVLAGPSGSGKTILLETIAGIHSTKASGVITLDGENINHQKISHRNVGLVFQDNTLFPHLTVEKNIRFALRYRSPKENVESRFNSLVDELTLGELLHRYPETLSGGEIQRVLLARTMASNPGVLLLDEPLSGVDTHKKDQLKNLLRNLNRDGQTIIHVTHDFEEAFSLANKMGIMHHGKLIGIGTPEEILQRPENKFVARFCGYKNYFPVIRQEHKKIWLTPERYLEVNELLNDREIIAVLIKQKEVEILADPGVETKNHLKGKVKDMLPSVWGSELIIDAGIEISVLVEKNKNELKNTQPGVELFLHIPQQAIRLILK